MEHELSLEEVEQRLEELTKQAELGILDSQDELERLQTLWVTHPDRQKSTARSHVEPPQAEGETQQTSDSSDNSPEHSPSFKPTPVGEQRTVNAPFLPVALRPEDFGLKSQKADLSPLFGASPDEPDVPTIKAEGFSECDVNNLHTLVVHDYFEQETPSMENMKHQIDDMLSMCGVVDSPASTDQVWNDLVAGESQKTKKSNSWFGSSKPSQKRRSKPSIPLPSPPVVADLIPDVDPQFEQQQQQPSQLVTAQRRRSPRVPLPTPPTPPTPPRAAEFQNQDPSPDQYHEQFQEQDQDQAQDQDQGYSAYQPYQPSPILDPFPEISQLDFVPYLPPTQTRAPLPQIPQQPPSRQQKPQVQQQSPPSPPSPQPTPIRIAHMVSPTVTNKTNNNNAIDSRPQFPWATPDTETITVPPGSLGVRISNTPPLTILALVPLPNGRPSPLAGRVRVGDIITSFDQTDTTASTTEEFGRLVQNSWGRSRQLTVRHAQRAKAPRLPEKEASVAVGVTGGVVITAEDLHEGVQALWGKASSATKSLKQMGWAWLEANSAVTEQEAASVPTSVHWAPLL